jgi:signal transduction histidine kinase
MPDLPQSTSLGNTRFRLNLGQAALASACAIILVALSISTYQASRTSFREASVLSKAEAPAASLIFTQRESLVYAARVGEWLGGTIPRREVQIARALLAQRLNVVTYDNHTTGEQATPEYLSSLKSLDTIIDSAPSGILSEADQHVRFNMAHPYLDAFIAASRDVVVKYQQEIDKQLNTDAHSRAVSSEQILFLLYALIALGLIFFGWISYTLLRRYRLARMQIAHDTLTLEHAQVQLNDLTHTLEAKRIADQAELDSREAMRYASRAISISIREFSEQEDMAENFCARVGEVFGSDYVAVETFPDDRVSRIQSSWITPRRRGVLTDLYLDPVHLQDTISTLWAESSLLFLSQDDLVESLDPARQAIADQFRFTLDQNGFKNILLLPIGEGSKAFGYVLVGTSDNGREWDEYSRQTLQFLGAHLAYSIVESELIATQRVVQELEALNVAKNDFISTVNHELRTPLTSIIGYIDLLKDLPKEDVSEQAGVFLQTLDRNALALLDLVESMLSLSRLDANEKIVASQEIDLFKILKNAVFVLEPTAATKNIKVDFHANSTEDKYLVSGDSGQLSQVFINLVSNAIKFSHENTEVIVEISRTSNARGEDVIRTSVRDTGIGIPPQDIDNLFTRFFRAQNAVEGQVPGTGLGLAIVDRIVKFHGGEVTVESELGKGTTMTTEIPTVMGRVDALVAARREGVLGRAIHALESADLENLFNVAHEMAGAIGMYSFELEGEELREFSHWVRNNPSAPKEEIEINREAILAKLQKRYTQLQGEGAK